MVDDNIITHILKANYEEAAEEINDKNAASMIKLIFEAAEENPNMTFLGFAIYMFSKTNNSNWGDLVISILCFPLNWINGSEQLALHYQREVLKMVRNVNNLQMMLFFYKSPDCDFDEAEARTIAKEILDMDPSNNIVKEVFPDLIQ